MIQYEKTLEQLGYSIQSLSEGSHKPIVVTCDYCGKDYLPIYKNYLNGKKKYPFLTKDAGCCCASTKAKDKQIYLGTFEKTKEEMKEKQRSSMLEKYGENGMSRLIKSSWEKMTEERKEEIQRAKLEGVRKKYGVDYISQVPEIRNKAKKTMVARFGKENASQVKELCEKRTRIIREKFKADNYFLSDHYKENQTEYQEKIKKTCIERFGVENAAKSKDIIDKSLDTREKNGHIKIYEGKRLKDWAKDRGISRTYVGHLLRKYGPNFVRSFTIKKTIIEQLISNLLDKHDVKYEYNKGLYQNGPDIRADFRLIDHKVIIEADGLYWHCDQQKPDDYHVKKRQIYIDNGYLPLFFRSDEIESKLPIVESIILNKLGICSSKIHGRQCEILALGRKEAQKFLDENHLMGKGVGKCFALKYNNEIVAALQVKNKSIKENLWEVSRFCTRLNTSVSGGYSKLIKRFLDECNPSKVLSFCDLRYGSGAFLKKLGWKLESCHPSFSWTDGETPFHRMKFKGNEGYRNGLTKIWDCGQAKYTLNCN